MEHSWFLSRPIPPHCLNIQPPVDLNTLQAIRENDLEEDLLKSLSLMGWSNKHDLLNALKSDKYNRLMIS
jgi:hypothetical protein